MVNRMPTSTNAGLLPRATIWQLRTRQLVLPNRPLLMGVVNVTPDSFSDGGEFLDVDVAVRHALQMAGDGANIIDVGGESTRPGARPVSDEDELERVMPVIRRLVDQMEIPVSIDTRKTSVAAAAVEAGAEIINDVSGLTGESEMICLAADSGAAVCVMHMQGTPETMQVAPVYGEVVRDVSNYLHERRDALIAAGIDRARICLDPGIGFGKTLEHNLSLLRSCHTLHELGCPLLVGHSRKSFLGKIIGDDTADRTAATVGVSLALAAQGVQILRVHDVRPVREALAAFGAAGGINAPIAEN